VSAPARWYRDLPLRGLWIALGWTMAGAIALGSLLTLPPVAPDLPQGDKLQHLLAYGALTAWFAQITASARALLRHAAGFVLLGAGLEVLQSLNPDRQFEFADMLANAAGVLLGLVAGLPRVRDGLARLLRRRTR
jgi:VanZ family protein